MTFDPFSPDFPEVPEPVYERTQRCTHAQTEVRLPSGVVVLGSSMWAPKRVLPHFGLFLDPRAVAESLAVSLHIPWQDHGLPLCDGNLAAATIRAAWGLAQDGYLIEVGCYAGHGRTVTVLACMAKLDGHPDPLEWAYYNYCSAAVDAMTDPQRHYVAAYQ